MCVYVLSCFRRLLLSLFDGRYRALLTRPPTYGRLSRHRHMQKRAVCVVAGRLSIAIWRSECVSFGRVARANIGCLGDFMDENIQIRIIAIAFVRNFPFLLSAMLLRIVYHAHFMCLCARALWFHRGQHRTSFQNICLTINYRAVIQSLCAKKTNSYDITGCAHVCSSEERTTRSDFAGTLFFCFCFGRVTCNPKLCVIFVYTI